MSNRNVPKITSAVKFALDPAWFLENSLNVPMLFEELGLQMHALATSAGTVLLRGIIEAEAQHLAGEKHSREGEYYPWGHQAGWIMVGGQKVRILRPRIRHGRGKGKEMILPSYQRFQHHSDRANRVFAQALSSVSCRDFGGAIEQVCDGYGVSRSVVSRELIRATERELEALCQRDLKDFRIAVLIIDGIVLGGSVFL